MEPLHCLAFKKEKERKEKIFLIHYMYFCLYLTKQDKTGKLCSQLLPVVNWDKFHKVISQKGQWMQQQQELHVPPNKEEVVSNLLLQESKYDRRSQKWLQTLDHAVRV